MTPDLNFSSINLQYFILARDLINRDPEMVATLMGISDEMSETLTLVTPTVLGHIARIEPPLLMLRQEPWWWERLFTALKEGRQSEIEAVLDHSGFITTLVEGDTQ